MTKTTQQSEQTKTPFFLSEQNQTAPSGYFFMEDDVLVVEFLKTFSTVRINQQQSRQAIDFISDSSFSIVSPDNKETKILIHLTPDGAGRFVVYGIRSWTGIDGTEPRVRRKQAFLKRFDSVGAKVAAFWQLILPYVLFGCTFLLHVFIPQESSPEVAYFVDFWQRLALSPIVAVHYVLFLIPGIAILFYNRKWALRIMFLATWLLVLAAVVYGFLPVSWPFLPLSESPLVLPEYWMVLLPYLLLLVLPSFYYIVVFRRQ